MPRAGTRAGTGYTARARQHVPTLAGVEKVKRKTKVFDLLKAKIVDRLEYVVPGQQHLQKLNPEIERQYPELD